MHKISKELEMYIKLRKEIIGYRKLLIIHNKIIYFADKQVSEQEERISNGILKKIANLSEEAELLRKKI